MNTLKLFPVVIKGDKGKADSVLLNLGDGSTYESKEGTRYKGHAKGSAFWLGLAQLIESEGLDMFMYTVYDTFGKPESADTPAPPPAKESVPTPPPAALIPATPPPAAPTPPPVKVSTPAPPPVAPTAKPTHSLDYCPRRIVVKGQTFGLRDGIVYNWVVDSKGRAPHYRTYLGDKVSPATFETPSVAPTVKAAAPTPKPTPSVRTVPVAKCELLPENVLNVTTLPGGVVLTTYFPLPGENYCRTILSKIDAPAAK